MVSCWQQDIILDKLGYYFSTEFYSRFVNKVIDPILGIIGTATIFAILFERIPYERNGEPTKFLTNEDLS